MKFKKTDIFIILVGCIGFGAALAVRDFMPELWLRALIAAVAFVILGFTLNRITRPKKKNSIQSDPTTSNSH